MADTINPREEILNDDSSEIALENLDKLKRFLDSATSPPELVEHWQWAKKEYGNE